MAKSQKLAAALEHIKQIQPLETLAGGDIVTLQTIVAGKQPMAIAPATDLIFRHKLVQLVPDMVAAFHRMLHKGEKTIRAVRPNGRSPIPCIS